MDAPFIGRELPANARHLARAEALRAPGRDALAIGLALLLLLRLART